MIRGNHRRLFSSLTQLEGHWIKERQRTVSNLRQQSCFAECVSRCVKASGPAPQGHGGEQNKMQCEDVILCGFLWFPCTASPCHLFVTPGTHISKEARTGVPGIPAHKHFMDLCSFTTEPPWVDVILKLKPHQQTSLVCGFSSLSWGIYPITDPSTFKIASLSIHSRSYFK